MKTISLRELHNDTGKWIRSVKDEEELIITDRGVAIASVKPMPIAPKKKVTWGTLKLRPGFAALRKAGKLSSGTDSSVGISEDRSSRDDSVAGIER
jgi:antitoxin (DNA-binding transcriptional repressor) of toxin-antitoxin stability system